MPPSWDGGGSGGGVSWRTTTGVVEGTTMLACRARDELS
jgi:hypothetical protein